MSEIKIAVGGKLLSVSSEDQELSKICTDNLIPTENHAAANFAIHEAMEVQPRFKQLQLVEENTHVA